jgi:hypothetical protein
LRRALWVIIMNSKAKIFPTIVKVFVLILGLGFAVFALLILDVLLTDFEYIGLLVLTAISLFSILFLSYSINSLRYIEIDNNHKYLKVIYLGFYKVSYDKSSILGYCSYPFSNRIGTYPGILLEFTNGKQIQLSEFDIKNFKEIEDSISSFIDYKNDIKLKYWTKTNKILVIIGGMAIVMMILGKILKF